MTTTLKRDESEERRNERVIRSLADRTGVALLEVRTRFGREFARLESGASIRSYLTLLTASNVLTALRREREPSLCAVGGAHSRMGDGWRSAPDANTHLQQPRSPHLRVRQHVVLSVRRLCGRERVPPHHRGGGSTRRAGTDADHGGTCWSQLHGEFSAR